MVLIALKLVVKPVSEVQALLLGLQNCHWSMQARAAKMLGSNSSFLQPR